MLRIFDEFVTVRSATLMVKADSGEGIVTKDGKPFARSVALRQLRRTAFGFTLLTVTSSQRDLHLRYAPMLGAP